MHTLSLSPTFRSTILRPIALACLLLTAAACTLIAPYDETTDRTVTELSIHTEAILARGNAGQLSQEESNRFLQDSLGTVRGLKARSGLYASNQAESAALAGVEDRLSALASRHKPLRSSIATALRLSLLDLEQIQIAKKRSSAFSASLAKKSSSTQ